MESSLTCEIVELSELQEASFPAEELRLADAISSPKRRQEFLLGRLAARRALEVLGQSDPKSQPILRGKDGEPLWPNDIVGSISHTTGVGVAVVGLRSEFESLGIDIELTSRKISDRALQKIALPAERVWIQERRSERDERALQIFCAKESIYKAYFPISGRHLTFKDAFVRWEEEHRSFVGTLLTDINEIHRAGDLLVIHCSQTPTYVLCCSILPRIDDA